MGDAFRPGAHPRIRAGSTVGGSREDPRTNSRAPGTGGVCKERALSGIRYMTDCGRVNGPRRRSGADRQARERERMLIRSVPWFVFFALVTGSSISDAQVPADSLIAGDLVQYELSEPLRDLPQESKGTFEALSPSVVLLSEVEDLEAGGMVELPRELISDFEVARGEEDVRWLLAGIGGVAGHSHKHFQVTQSGYISQLVSTNNYSAVTGA